MTVVVVFEEDVLRFICGYAPYSGRSFLGRHSFYDELQGEWDVQFADDLVMCLGDFNGHVDRHIDGFYGEYGVGQRNLEGRMSLDFCLEMELCVSITLFKREEKRKVTFGMGEDKTEIDFVFIRKEHWQFIQNV